MKKKKSLIIAALSIAIIGIISFNVLADGNDGSNKTPLDFCLFASDSININGASFTLNGGIRSNNKIYIWGSAVSIDGGVWCGTNDITISSQSVSPIYKNQPKMEMINIIESIEDMAKGNGNYSVINSNLDFSKVSSSDIETEKAFIVNGNIQTSTIIKDLRNYLIASGDISININNYVNYTDSQKKQEISNKKPVIIASKEKNVTISGNNVIVGTIYAPNGTVKIEGAGTYIVGSIIAKNIVVNGSSLYINDENKIIFDEDL